MNCNSLILKDVVENIGAAAIVFDVDSVVTVCNSMSAAIFGQSEGELIGRSLAELDLEIVDINGILKQKKGFPNNKIKEDQEHPVQFDFGLQVPSVEQMRWFRANLQPIMTGSEEISSLILSLVEITDLVAQKKTRDQIFLAKSEWETTVDALEDIVTIQDMERRIVRANKKAHELFGYPLGQLKGELCYEIFHNKSYPCEECPATLTSKDHSSHTGIMYNHVLDKTFNISSFPILDRDGNMYQFVHVARDITQSLLNESEKNRLMAAIEQASESVVIASKTREIQYVNPAFEATTGYGRNEAIGENLNFLKSGVHDQQFYDSMWTTLGNKQVWRGRLTNRKKDGTLIKEDATISAVLDKSGEIINYVALKRDVTREEILEQQLRQGMKMEALGTLAGGIAHDFNNILSAMLGYAEIAKGRLSVDHRAKKDLDHVIASGDRAVDLVKQILTFSRRESYGQFRLFKLQYIIKEVIKLLRPSLPATIEVKHEIDNSCRSVFADSGQIYQVLLNLCTNARQAIGKEHGCITIKLNEIKPAGQMVGVEFFKDSKIILDLEVSDTGCGIEKEMLDKIFDPFFTTRKKEQGTGLGLAVVHGIIKKHKGEISITSTVGEGTSVHVYLSADGGKVDNSKAISFAKPKSFCNERIMIIDDEIAVAEVLRLRLRKEGYKVTVFNNSIAAVTHFRTHPDCCDLVITDMLMPEMTGVELAREFIALRGDIPIILLTGHFDNIDKKRVRQLGVRELLLKPVKKEELYQAIRKVLDHG
ncbi:MAG: PAS domain-containing protein [Desulforhopalus sp.]